MRADTLTFTYVALCTRSFVVITFPLVRFPGSRATRLPLLLVTVVFRPEQFRRVHDACGPASPAHQPDAPMLPEVYPDHRTL